MVLIPDNQQETHGDLGNVAHSGHDAGKQRADAQQCESLKARPHDAHEYVPTKGAQGQPKPLQERRKTQPKSAGEPQPKSLLLSLFSLFRSRRIPLTLLFQDCNLFVLVADFLIDPSLAL